MIRGKFLAQDDMDLAGHRLFNWKWLDDIPHEDASDGQVIALVDGEVVWATLAAGGIVSVAWADITGKPSEYPPEAHTHGWDEVTSKPTFVNSVTAGQGIVISAQTGDIVISDEFSPDTNEPNGFVGVPGTFTSTIAVTDNRTFSIGPDTGAGETDFTFYVQGVKFTKTTTETITFPDTEGIHAFYYDSTGTLNTTLTPLPSSIFLENALVAICRWDSSESAVIYFGEERHGCVMDGKTHQYLHDTQGTAYISGMAIGNISADENGSADAHATCSIAAGTIADEDLFLGCDATASTYTDWYVYSKTDSGDWLRTATGTVPIVLTAGVTATYNLLSGTTWSQSQLTNNDYVLAHIFRTNSATRPFIAVQGEAVYGNQAAAREGAADELAALFTSGMPFVEFQALGTIIYQYSSAYGNAFNLRIRSTDEGDDYVDWRTAKITPSGAGPTDHGSLSGLADADHPLSALQQSGATTGQIPQWSGTTWVATTLSGSGLGVSSIAANAPLSANTSVGAVTLTFSGSASDVGLGNVTNEKQVVQGASGLANDYVVTADPPTTSYVLVEAIGGSQRIATLGSLPLSTETQSYVDALTYGDVGAASTAHTHTLTGLTQSGATTGQVPTWNATASEWQAADLPAGGYTAPTRCKMIYVENPTATDLYPMFSIAQTCTVQTVLFQTDAGTITFNLEERASGTPGTAGTDVFASDNSATATLATTSTFSNTSLAAGAWVYLACSAKAGSPTKLWVRVYYTEA